MKRRFFVVCMVFMGILTACESSKEEQEIQNQETTQEVEGVAEKETNGVIR